LIIIDCIYSLLQPSGQAAVWSYQQVQDPGGEGLKAGEAQPQVLQEADQHFDPEEENQVITTRCSLKGQ